MRYLRSVDLKKAILKKEADLQKSAHAVGNLKMVCMFVVNVVKCGLAL